MAEGRILSKRITRSEKVASLSSDTARMIYSWIIPYLDVEGRMEVNYKLLKSDIAPLLDHITPDILREILDELHKVGLIKLYTFNNKTYLQLLKFDEHQPNLRKDREKKTQIPDPPGEINYTPEQLRSNSGGTPEELPHKINIIEDNINKAKGTPEQLRNVDNSKSVDNPQDEKKSAFLKNLKALLEKTSEKYNSIQDQDAIVNFVKCHIRTGHPDAILHCINQLLKSKDKIKKIQPYLDAAFKIENGKYNAKDSELRNEEYKRDDLTAFSAVLKKITQEGKL